MLIVLSILFAQVAHAAVIAPVIAEQKDMGDVGLPSLLYSMSTDCTASTVTVAVMDGNFSAIPGADTFLSYVDFSNGILSSEKTDQDGVALHKLPGNPTLMRGLFVLDIQKYGFRNKEIHFDISPCYSNSTSVLPPKPNSSTPQTNQTTPQQPTVNTAIPNNVSNITKNASVNQSSSPTQQNPSLCPVAALIAALTICGTFFVLIGRKRKKEWKRYSSPGTRDGPSGQK